MFDEDWKRLPRLTNHKEKGATTGQDPTTSQAPAPDTTLNEDELEEIGGGLNPQPIPPGRQSTFAGSSGTGKTNKS